MRTLYYSDKSEYDEFMDIKGFKWVQTDNTKFKTLTYFPIKEIKDSAAKDTIERFYISTQADTAKKIVYQTYNLKRYLKGIKDAKEAGFIDKKTSLGTSDFDILEKDELLILLNKSADYHGTKYQMIMTENPL